ncbi:MAG TPA: outer membrane beta-barrel protein [Bacteroidales bacterium]|nr:outer membrane beta-barrel protein [Bacteroidales bacterium]
MKIPNLKLFTISLILTCSVFVLSGQEDCGSKLAEAQRLYRQGLIEDIPQLLKPCIESGFTRVQRNEAHKILILAYLFDGDQYNAENTMIDFLKKNPEYEVMPNDPIEFISLFETFRTLSVFSFGLNFGANATNPRIIEPYDQGNDPHTKSRNITGAGYQAGLSMNRYIARRIFFNLGINVTHNSYKFLEEQTQQIADQEPTIVTTSLKESLNRYEIPLSIGYEFEHRNFNSFIRAGGSVSKIFRVAGIPETDIILNGIPESDVTHAEEDMTDSRNSIFYMCHVGAGIKYKIPRGFLVFDIRYHYGINNIVIPEMRYNLEFLGHVDDDFSLNALSFSFGYYFSFYQPRKR